MKFRLTPASGRGHRRPGCRHLAVGTRSRRHAEQQRAGGQRAAGHGAQHPIAAERRLPDRRQPGRRPGPCHGDGVDETTLWSFNFAADPQYAAFLAEGGVAQALFSITLHTKFFVDGIGPPGAITGPSDGITGIFPRWNLSGAMTGVAGVYSRATFTTDLIGDVGLNPSEVMNWLTSHGGSFPWCLVTTPSSSTARSRWCRHLCPSRARGCCCRRGCGPSATWCAAVAG